MMNTAAESWSTLLAEASDISLARYPKCQTESQKTVLERVRELHWTDGMGFPLGGRNRRNFFLATFYVLIYKYSGRSDAIVGVYDDHAWPVPLRATIDPNLDFAQYATRVRDSYEQVCESIDPSLVKEWLPKIGIVIQDHGEGALRRTVPQAAAELCMEISSSEQAVTLRLTCDAECFGARDADRLLEAYDIVLRQALEGNPRICEIDILTEDDRRLLLEVFNNSDRNFKVSTFHGLFEDQVRRVPDSVALVDESESLSYCEANQRANRIAHYLMARGLERNEVVGVVLERTVDALVGMIGIMKAGGAYLPIEPSFPRERIAYMLTNSKCRMALVDADSSAKVPEQIRAIDVTSELLSGLPAENPEAGAGPKNLAYVIYTSGSTGEPKGVPIHHEGVANLHAFFRETFAITEHDRMTEFASFCFDTSVWEIVMCILSGASLHILSNAIKNNYARLEQYLVHHGITVATFPPTYLCYMNPANTPTLRAVAVAGSECPATLLSQWNEKVAFFNAYGPTEHSVCIAVFQAPRSRYTEAVVPIGKPLFNKRIYIVGPDGQMQPVGVPGELWVSGVGTSRGYLGREDLTQERFLPNPFPLPEGPRADKHSVVYRTGDMARWREDGRIEFLGRRDNQVKVRGYRIELDEVDSALLKVPGILRAGSVVTKDAEGAATLSAFYTASSQLPPESVRKSLAASQPEFMIPSRLMQIDTVPMTNSDKVDRKALGALAESLAEDRSTTAMESIGNPIVALLRDIVAKALGGSTAPTQWEEDKPLQVLGIDSLQFMKIVVGIEQHFEIECDDDFLLNGRSQNLIEIASLLDQKVPA
jgi:amino acid adenylation domain-containing protein